MNKRSRSGQALLVGVLIIALLLLSTELYVYDLAKVIDEANQNSLSDFIFNVGLGSKHVVIGSLANISQGGTNQTLGINLEEWSSFVGRQYQFGKCILSFSLGETSPYASGMWISWGTNGTGVSGAYVNFTLKLSDGGVDVNLKHVINITTTLLIESTHKQVQANDKQVNVTCNLLNEGTPALAKNLTLYYYNSSDWIVPGPQNNYTFIDYGNGAYFMSFVGGIPSENVLVSAHIYDRREIYVQANVTSIEI